MYERCGMGTHAIGVKCGIVEWMKRNTMWWFGHLKKKKKKKIQEFVKNIYVSETEGPRRRRSAVVRWKDRVKEYMHDKSCR